VKSGPSSDPTRRRGAAGKKPLVRKELRHSHRVVHTKRRSPSLCASSRSLRGCGADRHRAGQRSEAALSKTDPAHVSGDRATLSEDPSLSWAMR
jgi:hypothetical protein